MPRLCWKGPPHTVALEEIHGHGILHVYYKNPQDGLHWDYLLLLCRLVDQRLVDMRNDTSSRNSCLHHRYEEPSPTRPLSEDIMQQNTKHCVAPSALLHNMISLCIGPLKLCVCELT